MWSLLAADADDSKTLSLDSVLLHSCTCSRSSSSSSSSLAAVSVTDAAVMLRCSDDSTAVSVLSLLDRVITRRPGSASSSLTAGASIERCSVSDLHLGFTGRCVGGRGRSRSLGGPLLAGLRGTRGGIIGGGGEGAR